MHVLIVDDEALARARLRTLLGDCLPPHTWSEAAQATDAYALLQAQGGRNFDAVLLDIHMPGQDGLSLARQIQRLPSPPPVVFVTAHADHAVSAFALDATDYLTKPVRLQRLEQALAKAARMPRPEGRAAPTVAELDALLIQERGRAVRIPFHEILFVKAEQKYLTVRTRSHGYVLDGSLVDLEQLHTLHLLRIHRSMLIARKALRALEKIEDPTEGDGWAVRLIGLPDLLPVSRRQVPAVRDALLAR